MAVSKLTAQPLETTFQTNRVFIIEARSLEGKAVEVVYTPEQARRLQIKLTKYLGPI